MFSIPGDDAGEAAALLDALEVEVLESDELAQLLDGSRSSLTYGQLGGLLVRWLDSLPGWSGTPRELSAQPVLQDAHGRWATTE